MQTSAWCSCRKSTFEIHWGEACERPVALRFSAPRPSDETNRQGDACEGLAGSCETGVSTTLNAVRELYAGKLARTVLRGPYVREDMGLPSQM